MYIQYSLYLPRIYDHETVNIFKLASGPVLPRTCIVLEPGGERRDLASARRGAEAFAFFFFHIAFLARPSNGMASHEEEMAFLAAYTCSFGRHLEGVCLMFWPRRSRACAWESPGRLRPADVHSARATRREDSS